jgi:hypothetical protein
MTLQTPLADLDQDFEVQGAITKTWADDDGHRYIQGVVSGVEEDRDGERVSEDCIKSMVDQVRKGGVVATASHQQDWLSTFGEAVEAYHDSDTGEMIGKVRLPPKGSDPVADKAWDTVSKGSLGWSIGGKLRGAFFEKTELGKRRKVLDRVALKHFCLTDRPAYGPSFAEIVGKQFDGDPDDDEFVEKADAGVLGRPGGDSKTGDRNAGTRKKKAPSMNVEDQNDDSPTDDDDDTEDTEALPKAKAGRHLACPNCGHEFAADLPDDRDEETPDEGDESEDQEEANRKQTRKTAMEDDMPLKDTLAELRGLLDVEKEEPDPEPEPDDDEEFGKATTGVDGVVAKAVLEMSDRFDALEGSLAEAFETIAKSHKALIEQVRAQPLGRRSLARMPSDGLPPTVGHADEPVEKTIDDEIAETDSPVEALKLLNQKTYGIKAA